MYGRKSGTRSAPAPTQCCQRGKSTFDKSLLLPLYRHGYVEETYFTFAYSPIRDDTGSVGGLFCAVTEETSRVIGERRLKLLRDVAAAMPEAHTPAQLCETVTTAIAAEPRDLPFALIYLSDPDGKAQLAGRAGIAADHPAAPPIVDLDGNDTVWPLRQAMQASGLLLQDLAGRFTTLPMGAWDQPPRSAALMPLPDRGHGGVAGFLVVGLNPCRAFDEDYRGFLGLLAGQIAAGIANARAYEAERKRAEALDAIDRAKTAFFSNVSHEFRTPLTLMLGPLEDALNDVSPEALPTTQRARLEIAHRNSLRLLQLVNTLLDFSQIEAGRMQASYVPTDLAALTADLASVFRSAVERAGLTLEIDCPPLPQPVHVDRGMWETLLLNLLSNAFKFTFAGGIGVALKAEGDAAVLTVRDTGVGIPEHELPRLFERFHRIEGQPSRSFEGSGIGLALVQELVRLHGGRIAVHSKSGEGTTFTVTLPVGVAHLPPGRIVASGDGSSPTHRVAAFVEEALRWLPDGSPSSGNDVQPHDLPAVQEPEPGRRATVLVTDDNADMRDYLERLLRDRYDVITAPDGQAALEAIRHRRPDLVLSDVMMPRLDGLGLLRVLRTDPQLRDIPVILLSARAGEEARIEGLEAGADDYLTKPFAARELHARVSTNLKLAQLRREVAQAALDSAERLHQMFEQAPGFMCMLRGPDHVFELANAAYTQFVGNRELLGKSVREAIPEVAGQGYLELLDDVYRAGRTFSGRSMRLVLQRDPDAPATETFVNFVYQPIRDANGAVSGIFVEGFDVTDRVRSEMQLRELNRDLEERVAARTGELRSALEQLQTEVQEREAAQAELRQVQKMESIGQLTGGVAHDFNNLLTVIIGGLERVQRLAPGDDGGLQRAAGLAMQGAQRAAILTQRLLAFSRRQPLDPKPTDINRLVTDTAALLHRTLGETIELESVLSPRVWPIDIDRNQMENALLNLAVNARDAMPGGGKLTIETANVYLDEAYAGTAPELQPGQYVAISVSDTGCGMPPETLERVFEPFFTTKEIGRGTGLGLSQVYGFIKQSGGHVRIYSEPGQGTTVRLYLPRHLGDTAAPQSGSAQQPPLRAKGEVVLVVEDDAQVRAHTTEALRELGYRVLKAEDAQEALRISASADRIDLLFTDVVLPGGRSGRQLAEALLAERPTTKVLYTTGYARNAIVHQGRLDRGTALITKPFAMRDLAVKVWTVLNG